MKPIWDKDYDPPLPTPQRRKGTGSVSQRKEGRWVASIPRWDGGGRRYAYAPTKTAAEAALKHMRLHDAQAQAVTQMADELMTQWVDAGSDERKRRALADKFVKHMSKVALVPDKDRTSL